MFVVFEDKLGNKVQIDEASPADSLATLLSRLNAVQPNEFQLKESELKPSGLRLHQAEGVEATAATTSASSASPMVLRTDLRLVGLRFL